MQQAARPAVPAWFWIVAVLALLWEGMGCFSYLAQTGMMGARLATMPADEAEVWRATPVWVWCAFAIAVWVGLAGALLLLLRHRLARAAFALSLLAAIVQFGWAYTAGGAGRMGAGAALLPVCIVAAGAFLVWFADWSAKRGWLG
jgi:hypothetical protein